MDNARVLRRIWIGLLLVLVAVLLYLVIVPFGSITYLTDWSRPTYHIGFPRPAERIERSAAGVTAVGQPLYFEIFSPRPFSRAMVTLEYSLPAPMIEIGVRRGQNGWSYERRPIQADALNELAQSDQVLREGDVMLWQKKSAYDSVAEFLANPPERNGVVAYHYDISYPYSRAEAGALSEPRRLAIGARGRYTMLTYSSGDSIEIDFEWGVLESADEPETVEVMVYGSENLIERREFSVETSGASVTMSTPPLTTGAYRIEVEASDNIVTEAIRTRQAALSFAHHLRLHDAGRRNLTVYTNGENIQAQTSNPASRQTLTLDGRSLELSETFRQFSLSTGDYGKNIKTMILERDDVIITGDGVFAWSPEEVVDPSVRQFVPGLANQLDDFSYLIASYRLPETGDSGGRASVEFDLAGSYGSKGEYAFMIALPGIEDVPDGIALRSVSVHLEGDNVIGLARRAWEKISRRF